MEAGKDIVMESIESILGNNPLTRIVSEEERLMIIHTKRMEEMAIFDAMSREDRDYINYSDVRVTPSLHRERLNY